MELLLQLAKNGALYNELATSTRRLAQELGMAQQTISRRLRQLESDELIDRKSGPKGITVQLTTKAEKILHSQYQDLKEIFKPKLVLNGTIHTSLGEGGYYIRAYSRFIKKALGFAPYPGTLNAEVNKAELKRFMVGLAGTTISQFTTKSRSFGAVNLYRVKVGNLEGAIIKPERTRHEECIIELIAPVHLRTKLKLKDGDIVRIQR